MTRKFHRPISTSTSSGWKLAQSTGRLTESAAVGLFRWATTDHSGMTEALSRMPPMGIGDTLKYLLTQFMCSVLVAVITGIGVFLLIGYVIPYLIMGSF